MTNPVTHIVEGVLRLCVVGPLTARQFRTPSLKLEVRLHLECYTIVVRLL